MSFGLIRENYFNLPKDRKGVLSLTESSRFPLNADQKDVIENFDTPVNIGDHYGQRVHGWFLAPQSGKYTFYRYIKYEGICLDHFEEYLLFLNLLFQ